MQSCPIYFEGFDFLNLSIYSPVGVQPSGRRLGMSCRYKHLGFDLYYKLPMNYLIHGSGGWGRESWVYYPRVGPKGPALVRFLIIIKKNKKIKMILSLSCWFCFCFLILGFFSVGFVLVATMRLGMDDI